jgi:FkbM family methyltransferase
VKAAVKKAFGAFGLELRKKPADGFPRVSMRGALRQLSNAGFRPRTVIDVGVAYHTKELYEEFPEAQILLVEPLAEFEQCLKEICGQYRAQYVLAAAGAEPGEAIFNVHPELDGSSLLTEVEGSTVDGTPRRVPVVTLDQLCAEKGLSGPYLVKLDVQGAELKVLDGARRILKETEAIHLELTLFGTMLGGPQFFDIVARMKEIGFVAYDVCGFLYRPLDGALAQMDMVFVREDGPLRASHAFATPEQRKALAWKPDARLVDAGGKTV